MNRRELNFTAIDFETANHSRASACAVGLARVRGGQVVDHSASLIRPPPGHSEFHPIHVGIHKITAADVAGAPSAAEVMATVGAYVGDELLVAHNARFDIGVLRSTAIASGAATVSNRFVCTMRMARKFLDLPSYRLPFVATALNVPFGSHHDPQADALASAQVAIALAERQGVAALSDLAAMPNFFLIGLGAPTDLNFAEQVANEPTAATDHPLFGKAVCFTGGLASMTRDEAWELISALGAKPKTNVSKKLDVLVYADLDEHGFLPGSALTGKAQKAFGLRAEGHQIEVMTEEDFLHCL